MEKVLGYIKENEKRYLDELIEWLKIPSISSDSTKNDDTRKAGQWIADKLTGIGIENVKLMDTGGHPVVYGDWLHAEGKPTVLVYGHYDVQPVDPLEKWHTKPFEPTIKDGKLYGRGTSDDKGQLYTHYCACEALMKTQGKLPVNVKFFLEGEEEAGTGNTEKFVEKYRDLLACDVISISDTNWHSREIPTIIYALRGLCYLEFKVKGPNRDLHSGMYGGMVQNPLNAIARIIAKMHDDEGVVQVPGYYDDVLPLTDAERKEFASIGNHDEDLKKELELPDVWGEKGYTSLERNWGRPAMDINGIWGGFAGEGQKTVIASEGGFKLSNRLVANQDPKKIGEQILDYVKKICPKGVTVEGEVLHSAAPVMFPPDSEYMKHAVNAFETAFGKRPVLVREGASIPITATLYDNLKAPAVMMGYGLPDDAIHSPNEKMELDLFYKGIACNALAYMEYAK